MLVTISHEQLDPPLRFVSDIVNHVSRGDEYLGWPFRIALPAEKDDELSSVQIEIDNVDRRIMEGIRRLTTAPTVTLEVVLASQPDTLEAGPFVFALRATDYTAFSISGTLAYEDILNEPWPQYLMTPATDPGIFP